MRIHTMTSRVGGHDCCVTFDLGLTMAVGLLLGTAEEVLPEDVGLDVAECEAFASDCDDLRPPPAIPAMTADRTNRPTTIAAAIPQPLAARLAGGLGDGTVMLPPDWLGVRQLWQWPERGVHLVARP
ncbi:hypothetical protein K7472_09935 [Streptomyces sp. PTM05]|uniref:Uncharacterized protein n=1 Tax=Streptantibioticus parmotrematis TaxID=2873249 RepID=A0ABS7QPR4_9ACTN|nr:hypothetical protein [Streptantibioticus parmotrematis]MBY8885162.1 hypothetical protein [Streptantibioticus parmotrematis]